MISDIVVIYPPSFKNHLSEYIILGSFDLLKNEIYVVRVVSKECERFTWSGLTALGGSSFSTSGFCCVKESEEGNDKRERFKFFYKGMETEKKECKTQREFNDLFYSKHFIFYSSDTITLVDSDFLPSIYERLQNNISLIIPGLNRMISTKVLNEAPLDPNELQPRKYIANNVSIPIIDVRVVIGSLFDSKQNIGETKIELKSYDQAMKLKELQIKMLCLLPTSSLFLSLLLQKFADCIFDQITHSLSLFIEFPHAHKTQVFHFCPEDTHILTTIYPIPHSDESLTSLRTRYHRRCYLHQKPLLRIVQAVECGPQEIVTQSTAATPSSSSFSSSASSSSSSSISFTFLPSGESKVAFFRLKNVHHAIPNLVKDNASLMVVRGTYDYYHYMQDAFNDSGWGCAYRSCQTIQSWYYNEGLSRKPIQNHREIQKTIYASGQKKKGFVGSSEWIGSIEIQTVLSSYLGVDSKILHIPKGPGILDPSNIETIKDHFKHHGTPVMIGGGQLAYTLLGIYTNNSKTLFLILDPHYTGKDDLKTIVGKGWCGWKERESIFQESYFYNLCFPQVPNEI
jgi:hypothetical protein